MPQPAGSSTASGKITPPSTASLPRSSWLVGSFTKGMTANADVPPSLPQRFVLRRSVRSPKPRRRVTRPERSFERTACIALDHDLQIHPVRQPELQVDRCDGQAVDARAVGRVRVVAVGDDVHLELEMAGVDRVGALRLVRPIGAHLAHVLARRRIEERVAALVGRGLAGRGNRQKTERRSDDSRLGGGPRVAMAQALRRTAKQARRPGRRPGVGSTFLKDLAARSGARAQAGP